MILVQLDANAKLGPKIIKNDPHFMSKNGKLMLDVIQRQNLHIANSQNCCQGTITRERIFEDGKIERSVLDYVLLCSKMLHFLTKMKIDEERTYTLMRYKNSKQIQSDHNLIFCDFSLQTQVVRRNRREIFNFKSERGMTNFRQEIKTSSDLSRPFLSDDKFELKARRFYKVLNRKLHKCFTKI